MKDKKNNNFQALENKVMSEIKSGRVKLRSKYIFLAEKLGLNSALALSVILAVLFFNLVLFYVRATDNLEYLSFGKDGVLAFLESFPYLLVISLILFLLVAGYLISKSDWSYKKPFKYVAVGLVIFVLVIGGVLANTDISEKIEEQVFERRIPGVMFHPFLKGALDLRHRGVSGKINTLGDDYLIIESPRGLEHIDLKELKDPLPQELEKGQFIIVTGRRIAESFIADRIMRVDENELPMIGRGINRCFEDPASCQFMPPPNHLPPDKEAKECLDDCFKAGEMGSQCFEKCWPGID